MICTAGCAAATTDEAAFLSGRVEGGRVGRRERETEREREKECHGASWSLQQPPRCFARSFFAWRIKSIFERGLAMQVTDASSAPGPGVT